jgi:hypothetical protein
VDLRLSLLFAAAALAGLFACAPENPVEMTPAPQVTLTGVRMQYFKGSQLYLVGRAARVTYQRSSGEVVASEALLRLPQAGGPPAAGQRPSTAGLEVRAGTMEGRMTSRKATASHGVLLRTRSGLEGRTESARFDGETMEAAGDQPVHVEGPGYAMDAAGFHFWFNDEQFEFVGGVRSRLGAGP